jgi:hypothetical protein
MGYFKSYPNYFACLLNTGRLKVSAIKVDESDRMIQMFVQHLQDFPWLFITKCEYTQYGIHLAMQPLHLWTI